MPQNRTETGKFRKGHSGNPGGNPKRDPRLTEAARAQTEAAVQTLVGVMRDETATAAARVSAANCILDRAWGKPRQMPVEDGDSDGRIGLNFV